MVVAEALARGLPVVSTATGAIRGSRLASDAGRSVVVRPAISPAFTDALSRVIGDPRLCARSWRTGARRARSDCRPGTRPRRAMAEALQSAAECVAMGDFSAGMAGAARAGGSRCAVGRCDARGCSMALRAASVAADSRSRVRNRFQLPLSEAAFRTCPVAARRSRSRRCSRRVPKAPSVQTRQIDLATLDDRIVFAGRALVTASALLDLVSEAWLGQLAALMRPVRLGRAVRAQLRRPDRLLARGCRRRRDCRARERTSADRQRIRSRARSGCSGVRGAVFSQSRLSTCSGRAATGC